MTGRRLYRKIQEILSDHYRQMDTGDLIVWQTPMAGPVAEDNKMSYFESEMTKGIIWTHKYDFFVPIEYTPEECKLGDTIWILMNWFNKYTSNAEIRDYFFYAHCPKHRYLLPKLLEKYYKRNLWHY